MTKPGQLAIECPACPHPGRNIPPNWEENKGDAWLYTLFLAIDANFKLKSKSRQLNEFELGPGWSYFVASAPYQKHLASFVGEPEISTCYNEHDAILRANTRHTPGYDVSGVVLLTPPALTIHDVQLQLAKEEAQETRNGVLSPHKVSLSKFILNGLTLEEHQRTFRLDLAREKSHKTVKQLADNETKRTALDRDIQVWRVVQLVYTPCVSTLLSLDTDSRPANVNAEDIPLLLPSALPEDLRDSIKNSVKIEKRLREAQADDALNEIQQQRRIMHSVYQFKKLNVSGTGNKPNTRTSIAPASNGQTRNSNIDPPAISTPATQAPPSAPSRQPRNSGTESMPPYAALASKEFDETMRIEWSKSRARLQRWDEEVELVIEEMRRVLVFLDWKKGWWYEQGALRAGSAPPAVLSGLIAYAAKQAWLLGALLQDSVERWLPELSKLGLAPAWTQEYVVKGAPNKRRRANTIPTVPPSPTLPQVPSPSPVEETRTPPSAISEGNLTARSPSGSTESAMEHLRDGAIALGADDDDDIEWEDMAAGEGNTNDGSDREEEEEEEGRAFFVDSDFEDV
ncbi:hypothetical protein EYR36_010163 [Pleurotus pulmonarius]|nr:hypothetical protein EYR36_010163 [Pleurotus pulmonarius]